MATLNRHELAQNMHKLMEGMLYYQMHGRDFDIKRWSKIQEDKMQRYTCADTANWLSEELGYSVSAQSFLLYRKKFEEWLGKNPVILKEFIDRSGGKSQDSKSDILNYTRPRGNISNQLKQQIYNYLISYHLADCKNFQEYEIKYLGLNKMYSQQVNTFRIKSRKAQKNGIIFERRKNNTLIYSNADIFFIDKHMRKNDEQLLISSIKDYEIMRFLTFENPNYISQMNAVKKFDDKDKSVVIPRTNFSGELCWTTGETVSPKRDISISIFTNNIRFLVYDPNGIWFARLSRTIDLSRSIPLRNTFSGEWYFMLKTTENISRGYIEISTIKSDDANKGSLTLLGTTHMSPEKTTEIENIDKFEVTVHPDRILDNR